MTCKCGSPVTVTLSYTEREYCESCFEEYIEQRVRKDIRTSKPIEPLDTVSLYDDSSKEFFVAKRFLERVFEEHLTVEVADQAEEASVFPTNLDRYVSERLRRFLDNQYNHDERVYLLDNVLEEEIVALCRSWGRDAERETEVNMLVERMEEKYPDAKFSLRSAFDKLDEQRS